MLTWLFGFDGAVANERPRAVQGQNAPASQFHVPTTEPERALEKILLLNNSDDRVLELLLDREGGRSAFEKEFAGYFTRELMDAIAAHERHFVKMNCNGQYVPGDDCGFGFDPLNCAQDTPPDGYFMKTEGKRGDGWVIAMAWEPDRRPLAKYRIVRRGEQWMLDAVSCTKGENFNW